MYTYSRFSVVLAFVAVGCFAQTATVTATAPATEFTAHLDGYHVVPGYSTKATANFKISVRPNGTMGFDFTPQTLPGALIAVSLFQGQSFVGGSDGYYELYRACGQGPGNPRPACSQTGYSGAELVASDILPYGQSKDISTLLDLMRHNLVFIVATFSQDTYSMTIRGQLSPVSTTP